MFLEGADQIQSADSPEAMYARRRAAHWILNMAEESPVLDTALFRCVHWICGSLRSVLEDVERRISTLESRAGRAAHHAVLEELGKDAHHHVEGCSILADEHPYVCSYCWEQIQKQCRHVAENRNVSLAVEYIVAGNELNRVFGLDEDGIAVCEFAFILQHFPELKMYFAAGLGIFGPGGLRLMAQMLSMSQDILSDHLGMLLCFGILEYDKDRSFHLIPAVSAFWSSRFSVDASFFCSAFKDDLLPLKSFRVPGEEVRHVCRLLKEHVDFSVNILLYGPSGSGKKTFAHSLAKNIGMKVCLVSSRGKNSEGECRASFLACLHRASLQKGTLIVVDGAERLLSTDFDVEGVSGSQRKNTADMIFAFEKSGQKIVWITDDVEKIEPSVRRRFIYSIHFESLGVRERVEMWRHVLKRQGLSRRFDKSYMTGLAMKYPVQAEVVQSAIIQASSLYPSGNRFYTALDRILKAHLALQHGGRLSSKKVYGAVSDFTLNGVCMEENISVFMERCQRMDAAMRSGKVLRPGCGTMLFYGPPGTGKTALARFVAETLNRECIVKRASDLLSPFVGVSEQQVAEVFGEMEKKRCRAGHR